MTESTICALSTPVGTGGIAVIRVSGSEAIQITDRIFKGKSLLKSPSHHASHGYMIDHTSGEVIDEVLVLVMKGPRTFTGEDTVEIDCHGGMYICRRILESLIAAGCESAQPGEFSKRAFMNGRMDLNEAEAVMDMISAKTSYSLRTAVSQLGGVLSSAIETIRKQLLDMIVLMEVNIDYPEYDAPEISDEELFRTLRHVKKEIDDLLRSADSGVLLRNGIGAALVGKANAGKSSLLNLMLKQQRAIVTDIPGTTRDVLEESMDMGGILVRLIDTAGIRETKDTVEKIGVERSLSSIEKCDLVLWVLDGSIPVNEEDQVILEKIEDKPCLVLINKADLIEEKEREDVKETIAVKIASLDNSNAEKWKNRMILIEAKDPSSDLGKNGEKELSEKIRKLFFSGDVLDQGKPLITNMRQKESLIRAKEAIERVILAEGLPQDLLSIDIREAFTCLGDINGSSVSDEIVTEIFSRFCLGK